MIMKMKIFSKNSNKRGEMKQFINGGEALSLAGDGDSPLVNQFFKI